MDLNMFTMVDHERHVSRGQTDDMHDRIQPKQRVLNGDLTERTRRLAARAGCSAGWHDGTCMVWLHAAERDGRSKQENHTSIRPLFDIAFGPRITAEKEPLQSIW